MRRLAVSALCLAALLLAAFAPAAIAASKRKVGVSVSGTPAGPVRGAIADVLKKHALEPEIRAFHPHLTLGRWRDRARRPALPDVDLGTAHVGELVLYRSDIRPSGSIYTPLAAFPLGGAAAAVG